MSTTLKDFTLRSSFVFWSILTCCLGFAQNPNPVQTDQIYLGSVKTVLLYNAAVLNSFPIITLNSGEYIRLEFDDLSGKSRDLQYQITNCDADWKSTQMLRSEYMTGLYNDYVSDRKFSTGTYKNYVHYTIDFPNQNTQLTKSGNYIIKVYESGHEDRVILTRRFYVFEQKVDISGEVIRPNFARYNSTHQQVNFNVDYNGLPVQDPFKDIKVVIRQNWRTDNEVKDLPPRMIAGTSLQYNYDEENLFQGGNEFRPLDIHDVRMRGFGVRYFTLDSFYSATLYQDEDKSGQTYTKIIDQDGLYTVGVQGKEATNEADYINCYFRLKIPKQENKEVYIFGALTNWKLDNKYKMTYSGRDFEYQGAMLLKQGYYDYQYVTYNPETGVDVAPFEGSHWETENNYTIFVYWRPSGMNYDLLIGRGAFSSVRN